MYLAEFLRESLRGPFEGTGRAEDLVGVSRERERFVSDGALGAMGRELRSLS